MEKTKGKHSGRDDNGKRPDTDNTNVDAPALKLMRTLEPFASFAHIKVNQDYMNDSFVKQFRKSWESGEELLIHTNNVHLLTHPFKLCAMKNFLESETIISELINDMLNVKWSRKQMDLYELFQSVDLSTIDLPLLQQFMDNLKTNVMPWMEKLSGIELKRVSASCSMYNCGDYLLVHDDLVSDRQIAFVFYISPWEGVDTWTEEMGGSLELFGTDELGYPNFPIARRFNPRNNQLIFFKVGAKSFHQVAEVTSFDYPRITINGWFHGDNNTESNRVLPVNFTNNFKEPIDVECCLEQLINEDYLEDAVKINIHRQIEDESEISLNEFLLPDVYERLVLNLQAIDSDGWVTKEPANGQYYHILKLNNLTGMLAKLVEFLRSKPMFQLLHEYTELDLAGSNAVNPKVTIEIQKWSKGCYTILTDGSSNTKSMLDIILYINASDNVGVINYIAQDIDEVGEEGIAYGDDSNYKDQNSVLLTLIPKENVLNVIYRTEGTSRFIKYVSKRNVAQRDSFLVCCSYIE